MPSYTKPDAKPDYFRMFNARSEDMKPVFTRLLKQRRCVVLLNGFYEWKKVRLSVLIAGDRVGPDQKLCIWSKSRVAS